VAHPERALGGLAQQREGRTKHLRVGQSLCDRQPERGAQRLGGGAQLCVGERPQRGLVPGRLGEDRAQPMAAQARGAGHAETDQFPAQPVELALLALGALGIAGDARQGQARAGARGGELRH